MTFNEFVSSYGLSRSEGLVLRYLTDAYRTLRHTVPESHRTEELEDIIEWLGELVRQTDSSLLDEWEDLVNPSDAVSKHWPGRPTSHHPARPITANERAFTVHDPQRDVPPGRARLARRVGGTRRARGPRRRADRPAAEGRHGRPGVERRARRLLRRPRRRSRPTRGPARPSLLQVERTPTEWRLRQVVVDPDDDKDWGITAVVDLAASDEVGAAVLTVTGFERLGG